MESSPQGPDHDHSDSYVARLLASELLFQAIFDNVSIGMALVDSEGRVVAANDADCKFLGYSRNELLGIHFSEFTHPEDLNLDQGQFQRLLGGNMPYYVVEKRYLRKDRTVVWGRLNVSLIRDADGSIRYIVVLCEDITQAKRSEQAHRQSQAQLQALLQAISDVVVVTDRQGQFIQVGPTESDLYYTPGFDSPEQLVGHSLWDVFPPDKAQLFLDCTLNVLAAGKPQRLEYTLEFNRQTVWFDASVSPLGADQVVWVARDISDRKRLEADLRRSQEDLRHSEQNYRMLFENNPHPLWVYDLETLAFLQVNDAAVEKYGYSRDEFLAMTIADIRPAGDLSRLLENVAQVSTGLDQAGIWRHRKKDGTLIDVEITSHTLSFNGRQAELVLANDVSLRLQAESRLRYSMLHDTLTDLPNRQLLTQALETAIKQGKRQRHPRQVVLFLDLDRFKVVNDSLGHLVGDQVLVAMALTLKDLVRQTDLVARLGGDEFVILLDDDEPIKAAIRLTDRLLAELQTPLSLGEREVFVSASVGIVLITDVYTRAADLLRDADIAMYRAKSRGRGCYEVFDADMHAFALQRLHLENDLHQALVNQELVVYYQPIIALKTGKPVGFEALVRWQHPQRGLVSPGEFIPLAEEIGLIIAIDRWVLETVCYQLADWTRRLPIHLPIRSSVNLSVQDLWNLRLIDNMDQLLLETGLKGHRLSLEITESMLIQDITATNDLINQLRQRGISISIDDFGTGYSSLSYLHQLPADTLKIDCSFVSQMLVSPKNRKIVETLITLSDQLDIQVIAEGIETQPQLEALKAMGCELGQGYWFSPPMPSSEAEQYLLQYG